VTEPFDPGRKMPPDWDHLDKYPLEPHLRALGTGPVPSDAILGITCPKLYDQGQTPKCVGYGTATLTTAMEYKNEKQWTAQKYDADAAYAWANANDGIPGAHDGSTTRAGFEYLRQQGAHITRRTRLRPNEPIDHKITQYLWAKTLDQLLQFMWAEQLPGMIGINWYNDMFNPDANGFIKPTGGLAGGHNLTVRGFSMTEEYVILRNSWNGWGLNNTGDAKVRFADMTKLLSQDGEAGAPVDIIGA
jgi:hypothetical protein